MSRWSVFLVAIVAAATLVGAERSNVVLILADDLGYGDVHAYNATSKIPTPHLDRLAAEGMRFTDAHTPSAVCTPTRYGLLTGRYAWRTSLKSGVLDGFDPPLIEPGRATLASLLRAQGYATACVGKWHLGMTWTRKDGGTMPSRKGAGGFRPGDDVDFTKDSTGGPLDCGFERFFGIAGSLDMPPYGFIEGRRIPVLPVNKTPDDKSLVMNQAAGVISPGFAWDRVLGSLTAEAVRFIESRANQTAPFFLYLPLNSPHLPVAPSSDFRGKSGAGEYADFVMETDARVGAVLAALERLHFDSNTLVLFTSDNGGLWHQWTARERDDVAAYKPTPRGKYNAARGHFSNASLRGTKADIFEGGHRVPFIVRWPKHVTPNSTSAALVELTDVFATIADIIGVPLPRGAAEDSFSFLPALRGESGASLTRPFAVHHSLGGLFALREGRWKFVPARGSGGFSVPKAVTVHEGEPVGQLYDLEADPMETRNVWQEHPDVVARLAQQLERVQLGTGLRL